MKHEEFAIGKSLYYLKKNNIFLKGCRDAGDGDTIMEELCVLH